MQLANPATFGATLKDLLRTDSARLFEDAPYLKARLSDRVPQSMPEISVLVMAQKAGVPQSLYYSPRTYSLRSSLIARLHNDCGLSQEAASWAVACWASALDITFVPDTPAVAPPRPPAPTPPPLPGPDPGRGGAPIDLDNQRTRLPADPITPGTPHAGVKRIPEQNRPRHESDPQMIRKLATVAVIVDAIFGLVVILSRTPADFPTAPVAGVFLITAIVVTFAVLFNTRHGKVFARILLFGSGLLIIGDVYAVATAHGIADVLGLLLDGLSFYMCFRVGFERAVPTQPQPVSVQMRPL